MNDVVEKLPEITRLIGRIREEQKENHGQISYIKEKLRLINGFVEAVEPSNAVKSGQEYTPTKLDELQYILTKEMTIAEELKFIWGQLNDLV